MFTKVAVVTGANKGIGFAIVRGLCKQFDGAVYLTSRDINRGIKAVEDLKKEGLNPKYHQLDITDKKSVETFRDYIKENYNGIDVLINNAVIAFKCRAPDPVSIQAEQTLFVNYFSLVTTCDILFPILNNGAKVVNISSAVGHLTKIPSEELRKKFLDTKSVQELSALMQKYIDDAKQGTQAKEWGGSSYAVSKVGVTALTFIQQKLLSDRGIIVNAVHPGYVDTDLTSHRGRLTIDQGAVTPLYAALEVTESFHGRCIWSNKEVIDWSTPRSLRD